MEMTSREIVKRCIEFRDPPRCGWHFAVEPLHGKVWPDTDFYGISPASDPRFEPPPGATEWVTEWGDTRSTLNTALGESIRFPLADGWHLLEQYRLPDLAAPERNAHLAEEVAKGHAMGRYVYGWIPGLMLQPIDLRGIENWFMDHLLYPAELGGLLDRIVELRDRMIDLYAAAGADGVITYDDMGTNSQAFVSPECFREMYFSRYKHSIDHIHEHNMHFLHHCCGQVRAYMEMFVEAGCDVIQLDQPRLMGIKWLGEHYAGKICFWNSVDIQQTLGTGDLQAIEAEAKLQLESLSRHGGFMVKSYQQPESIKTSVAEMETQYQAFRKYGVYAK